jgi:glyoxylase-like metal-dependent hydrolase (beta-lactamase superfamily II)
MREVVATLIRAGHCIHPQLSTLRDGSWRPIAYPALSILIAHPVEGPMLFDTGYDPAFFEATQAFPERLYRWVTPVTLPAGSEVAAQLRRFGLAPSDIRHLIISHFHADHVAGTHAFPNAVIHCSKVGLDAACSGGRITTLRRGVLRALLPADFAARARFFEDDPRTELPEALQPFEMGADIIGDGSVLAVELPGHCPGHWGAVINDSVHGEHFLVGDATWSVDAIRRGVTPPTIISNFLGNARRADATLRQLHALWRRNPAIHLTPSHCRERAAQANEGEALAVSVHASEI